MPAKSAPSHRSRRPKSACMPAAPTVYNYQHIGNLRTYIFEDILRRALEYSGYEVHHVVNITDVGHLTSDADTGEDKMEAGARRTGLTAWEIAEGGYTADFQEKLEWLNVRAPHAWCRATDHIREQIAAIAAIEEKGYTYRTDDGLYFDTSRLNDYGHLARLNIEGLQGGQRVDLGQKRRVTDFALWKFSPADTQRQMEWDSPWGRGFPGWHIECTAMAAKLLRDRTSTSTAAARITSRSTTPTKSPKPKPATTRGWPHSGSTARFYNSTGRRCPSRAAISCALNPSSKKATTLSPTAFSASERATAPSSPLAWESLSRRGHGSRPAARRRPRLGVRRLNPTTATYPSSKSASRTTLNMPRVLALCWELVADDLPDAAKKATLLHFDQVMGLGLAEWTPQEEDEVPDAIHANSPPSDNRPVTPRIGPRPTPCATKSPRAGYEIEDTPQGPNIRPLKT